LCEPCAVNYVLISLLLSENFSDALPITDGRGYYHSEPSEAEAASWSDIEDERERSRPTLLSSPPSEVSFMMISRLWVAPFWSAIEDKGERNRRPPLLSSPPSEEESYGTASVLNRGSGWSWVGLILYRYRV
jgi:hypothetical protein